MSEYKQGEVYRCADPSCNMEVTINKACTGDSCTDCAPLMCCDKPMMKKS
jgi:hypothetical protein